MLSNDDFNNTHHVYEGTGNRVSKRNKLIHYPFGKFEILVELADDNQFIGVKEIRLRKDFRTITQRLASSKGVHDVDEFYQE